MKSCEKFFFWSLVSIVLLVSIFRFFSKELDRKRVISNYQYTIGKLTEYRTTGPDRKYYVAYTYNVLGETFSTEPSAPPEIFPDCEYDFKICSEKRFWVAYQKDDPSNSLINLHIEIQNIEDANLPDNIDNFR